MTFLEYCESVSKIPITNTMKEIINAYDKAMSENKTIMVITPMHSRKQYMLRLEKEYRKLFQK